MTVSSAHILVVDDEHDILPEYQEFFEFAGLATRTCASPLEAVKPVLNTPEVNLVITDLRMGQLDGASMIRDLRAALPPERRTQVICRAVQLIHVNIQPTHSP